MMKSIAIAICFSLANALTGAGQSNGIEYVFNKNVEKEVRTFLESSSKDTLNKFYFILSKNDLKVGGNYLLSIGVFKDTPLPFVADILKASSRFYKFNDTRIPICFDYDFDFIGYGQNKRGVTRKTLVGEFFSIEFSKNDKIIRKGY